ncbi:MAG: PadR family transcriptional regulator [Methanomassiliicoccales archaeon]|nr:PadR family transcriptional regulator [Methanomassiliicoccales archaeon]TFG55535.1 MAG: PadR family transcriptional regulator [Methanomassiliicoccus sp.]
MIGNMHVYKGERISASQLIMMIELMDRPMYGYELIKAMREEYEGVWVPQTGSVYPALRRLQEHGLLSVENLEGKDHYTLTIEGHDWLDGTLASMSSGMLFMARTMSIMGRAYLNRKGQVEGFVPLDEEAPRRRLDALKEIRDTMQINMRMIETHIQELEKEVMD